MVSVSNLFCTGAQASLTKASETQRLSADSTNYAHSVLCSSLYTQPGCHLFSLQSAPPMPIFRFAAISTAQRGTLHVILTEELGAASTLSPADQKKRLPQVPRAPSDLIEEFNPGSSNRRAITAAVTAQMISLDANIAETGVCCPRPIDFARIVQHQVGGEGEGEGGEGGRGAGVRTAWGRRGLLP